LLIVIFLEKGPHFSIPFGNTKFDLIFIKNSRFDLEITVQKMTYATPSHLKLQIKKKL